MWAQAELATLEKSLPLAIVGGEWAELLLTQTQD